MSWESSAHFRFGQSVSPITARKGRVYRHDDDERPDKFVQKTLLLLLQLFPHRRE